SAHQELFGDIAGHLAEVTQPFKDGKPDTAATHDIIHSTMVANPGVEVYLLDPTGRILDYVVPDTSVKLKQVNIAIVKTWLAADPMERPMGDNPKQPNQKGIFSAAPVYENSLPTGYVYAVLASEKQEKILARLDSDLFVKLGTYMFFAALLVAFFVGIITFFLITDSICEIAGVVQRFKDGDNSARISGHAKGNIGVLTSTFNEMADVIVENMDKISATDKFRQELIGNVSHDLRTPLSIMRGYVETLMIKRDQLSPLERDRFLSVVLDSCNKLSVLVDELFQYAKLEANLIVPRKENFLLEDLTSDIISAYQLKAAENNIDLQLDIPKRLPPVFADIALTERVLQNLIENSFKFTTSGGSICLQLNEVNNAVRVRVSDTGIGMSKEQQAFIFERYTQLSEKKVMNKGMGIGLAIVKKILDLHNSGIEVASEIGKGSVFSFELPAVSHQ
ncbi:MAG: HAMP domain-containing histidine kinase, partial [Chitinophagaceae bacterium]